MKLRKKYITTGLLVLSVFMRTGGIASESFQLKVTFRGKTINLDNNVSAVVKKRNGQLRIIIAARQNDVMFNLSGSVDGELTDKGISLNTSWHQLSIIMIQKGKIYNAAPSMRLLKNDRIAYTGKEEHGNRYRRRGATWKSMSRTERISRGRGMVRNRTAEGSSCSLALTPVFAGGEITALKGTFDGVMVPAESKRKRYPANPLRISGSFMVKVER